MIGISPECVATINGVPLCLQTFGSPGDPAVLLIGGNAASMLWWDSDFCETISDAGRFVIRYDHRDTGRSIGYPAGRPGYSGADLAADPIAILDHLGIEQAHVVGVSMGGALAQMIATGHPDRVRTLTLMSTSSAGPGTKGLPSMSADLLAYFESAVEPDRSDRAAVVASLVEFSRALAGSGQFDEPYITELVEHDVDRSGDVSTGNHMLADMPAQAPDLTTITVPTLVLHGSKDPLFLPEHGAVLASEIPGAVIHLIPNTGHVYMPDGWSAAAAAIIEHTSQEET